MPSTKLVTAIGISLVCTCALNWWTADSKEFQFCVNNYNQISGHFLT